MVNIFYERMMKKNIDEAPAYSTYQFIADLGR